MVSLGAPMDIYLGHLINWELQKLSSLIGQLATVHNCDWLMKKKQIYKLSSISPWYLYRSQITPRKTDFTLVFNSMMWNYFLMVFYENASILTLEVVINIYVNVRKYEWKGEDWILWQHDNFLPTQMSNFIFLLTNWIF